MGDLLRRRHKYYSFVFAFNPNEKYLFHVHNVDEDEEAYMTPEMKDFLVEYIREPKCIERALLEKSLLRVDLQKLLLRIARRSECGIMHGSDEEIVHGLLAATSIPKIELKAVNDCLQTNLERLMVAGARCSLDDTKGDFIRVDKDHITDLRNLRLDLMTKVRLHFANSNLDGLDPLLSECKTFADGIWVVNRNGWNGILFPLVTSNV